MGPARQPARRPRPRARGPAAGRSAGLRRVRHGRAGACTPALTRRLGPSRDSLSGPLPGPPGLDPHAAARPPNAKPKRLGPRAGAGARLPSDRTAGRAPAGALGPWPGLPGARTALGPGRAAASPAGAGPPCRPGRGPRPRRARLPPLVYTDRRRPPEGQEQGRGRRPSAAAAPARRALGLKRVTGSELRWRGCEEREGGSQNRVLAARSLSFSFLFLKRRFWKLWNSAVNGEESPSVSVLTLTPALPELKRQLDI